MPLSTILRSQTEWAEVRWPGHTGRRAPSLEENLNCPMPPSVQAQFLNGSGGELGTKAHPGKMWSLRSSSALGFNFFAPWIGQDLNPLTKALRQQNGYRSIQFERQFPHGLQTTPPNIDVTLDRDDGAPLAIECKFTEPYGPKKPHQPLAAKYFSDERMRWAELGLPRCQALAQSIGTGMEFRRLGVGQLLKHILGLAWTTKQVPRLICLWFDTGCEEAREHRAELKRFRALLDESVEFVTLAYQEVFAALPRQVEPIPNYFSYMESRYFGASHRSIASGAKMTAEPHFTT